MMTYILVFSTWIMVARGLFVEGEKCTVEQQHLDHVRAGEKGWIGDAGPLSLLLELIPKVSS